MINGPLDDPTVANSPLVFPTRSRCNAASASYYDFKGVADHDE